MRVWEIDRRGWPYFTHMALMGRPILRQVLARLGAKYEINRCVWRL